MNVNGPADFGARALLDQPLDRYACPAGDAAAAAVVVQARFGF
jgi:hypothetical protein